MTSTQEIAVGLDLGTTYSAVAVYDPNLDSVTVIANEQGNRTTPSVVGFNEEERLVGEAAKNQGALNPENTLFDIKRLIGREFSDSKTQEAMKHWSFNVVNSNGKPKVEVEFRKERKQFTPEEISAMIIGKMRDVASSFLGRPIKKMLITCFDPDTKVLMSNGNIKLIKDIKEGEYLAGDDDKKRCVISKRIGKSDMYLVEQSKGEEYIVTKEHILVLRVTSVSPFLTKRKNRDIVCFYRKKSDGKGISQHEKTYHNEEEKQKIMEELKKDQQLVKDGDILEMTVEDFMNCNKKIRKGMLKGYKVPKPINPDKTDKLPIDPYFLGLWLGDGSTGKAEITSSDSEIEDYLNNFVKNYPQMDLVKDLTHDAGHVNKQGIRSTIPCYHYRLIAPRGRSVQNPINKILRELNIFEDKHIPEIYMNASKEDRLKLVAGLIDSDGWLQYGTGTRYGFGQETSRLKLVEQMQTLGETLGFTIQKMYKSTRTSFHSSGKYKDEQETHDYHYIAFSGENIKDIPCLIDRKKLKGNINFLHTSSSSLKIKKLEGEYKGKIRNEFVALEVDGNGRFLLDDCTVVHNCPAYFNDQQRQATKDAGRIAGVDVIRIINEPTAAALAYGLDENCDKEKNILVFDLGGGTFDVTVLSIEEGTFEVKSTAGDTFLGGADFDNRILDYCKEQFKKKTGLDISDNARAIRRLRTASERAKRELSVSVTATVEVESIQDGTDLNIVVSRAQFENMCMPFFQKCIDCVDRAISDSKISKSKIDEIVLVGGSSRIPKIQEMLSKHFNGKKLCNKVNPDEAVAYGAAIQAAILSGVKSKKLDPIVLVDVTPLSLGIETAGGVNTILIPRNSKIPSKKSQVFSTFADNQTAVDIKIYEGERAQVHYCNKLGEFRLSGIPPMRAHVPEIEIAYEIDANGILTVNAVCKANSKSEKLVIQNKSSRLTKEDVERMVKEAENYKEEDEKFVKRQDAIRKLDNLVYMASNEDLLKALSEEEKTTLETEISEVKTWLSSHPTEEPEVYDEKFTETSKKLAPILSKTPNPSTESSGTTPGMDGMPAGMDMSKIQEMMKGMSPEQLQGMMGGMPGGMDMSKLQEMMGGMSGKSSSSTTSTSSSTTSNAKVEELD